MTALLSGFMIGASLFVLDTPKCNASLTQGSRQTVSSELTPREFHPNCRSDRAALIACDGLDTVRAVTGREYHYSLCGSWRNRELPDILSRYLTAHHLSSLFCLSAGHGVPLHTLMLITITKRKYLANDYSVVKELSPFSPHKGKRGEGFFALHPIVLGKPRFSPLLKKLFQFFFKPVHSSVNSLFGGIKP